MATSARPAPVPPASEPEAAPLALPPLRRWYHRLPLIGDWFGGGSDEQAADAVNTNQPPSSRATYSTVGNPLTKQGTAEDVAANGRPQRPADLSDEELEVIFTYGLGGRVVRALPAWATLRGWTYEGDDLGPEPFVEDLGRLRASTVFRDADVFARVYGDAAVWVIAEEAHRPLSQQTHALPLDVSRITRVHNLVAVSKPEMWPGRICADPTSPHFLKPETWRLRLWRDGFSWQGEVHASRLLHFSTGQRLPSLMPPAGWGCWSILPAVWPRLLEYEAACLALSRAVQEIRTRYVKLSETMGQGMTEENFAALVKSRYGQLTRWQSNRLLVLGAGEEAGQLDFPTSGLADAHERLLVGVATAAEYPLALLTGEPPGGLNTDGESWQNAVQATVAAHQISTYTEPARQLGAMLAASQGTRPSWMQPKFHPLGNLSARELAEIRKLILEGDKIAVDMGALSPNHVYRGRIAESWSADLPAAEPGEEPKTSPASSAAAPTPLPGAPVRTGTLPLGDAETDADWTGKAYLRLGLDASAVAAWRSLQRAAQRVVRLEGYAPGDPAPAAPHLTLLFLGLIARRALPGIAAVSARVAPAAPLPLRGLEVTTFPAGPDGRLPVILRLQPAGLKPLAARLLRLLAHVVKAEQHVDFIPHLTLGFVGGLTPEQQRELTALAVPDALGAAGRLELVHGSVVISSTDLSEALTGGGTSST